MQYYERSAAEVSGKPIELSVPSPADVAGLYLLAPRVTMISDVMSVSSLIASSPIPENCRKNSAVAFGEDANCTTA
jgi:hypothetical protein